MPPVALRVHLAAYFGLAEITMALLEKGFPPDYRDNHGRTPLSWASKNGHEAVIRLLIEKGAAVDSTDTEYGRTPLSWASEKGYEAVVRLLIEKGAAVDPGREATNTCAASYRPPQSQ